MRCVFVHGKYRVSPTYLLISGTFCCYPPIYRMLSRLCEVSLLFAVHFSPSKCVFVFILGWHSIFPETCHLRAIVYTVRLNSTSSRNQNTTSERIRAVVAAAILGSENRLNLAATRSTTADRSMHDILISHDWHQTKSIAADVNEKSIAFDLRSNVCTRMEDIRQEKSSRQGGMP